MKKFEVEIEGISPLLQARHPTPTELEQITKREASSKKSKKLTDKEQYDMHAFKVKSKYYQPAEMIEAAMTKAAANFKLEGKKSYKDVIKGGLLIEPVNIIHKIQKFVSDGDWGKNPTTRGAVWIVRPRADKWQLVFTINLLQDERVESNTLRQILEYAGLYVGIGAWRPKFGRFKIIKFVEK